MGIAVDGESVWILWDGPVDGTVLRINPATNQLVAAIELDFRPDRILAIEGAAFVTSNFGEGRGVARIDPATTAVTELIEGLEAFSSVVAGEGSLWISSLTQRTVSRLDPKTGEVLATIEVGGPAEELLVSVNGVWVTVQGNADPGSQPSLPLAPGSVAKIDPETNELTAAIETGSSASAFLVATAGKGAVWAINRDGGRALTQIDPETNAVTKTVELLGVATRHTIGDVGDGDSGRVVPCRICEVGRRGPAQGSVWVTTSVQGEGVLVEIAADTGSLSTSG